MPLADRMIACTVGALVTASASADLVQCSSASLPIPDGSSSASVVLTVPPDAVGTVQGVTVSVDVAHEWLGDLTISVSHGGQSAILIDRVGIGTWSFGCGGDDIDATFTDAATASADALCSPGGPSPMFFGEILPTESLGVFTGSSVAGNWTITVTDHNLIDAGVVNSVCISITTDAVPCNGDVTGDGAVDLADLNLVLASFGQTTTQGDADGSGEVDLADLNLVLGQFGADC